MSPPPGAPGEPSADGCAELRATVEARCEEARAANAAFEHAAERLHSLRRDLVAGQHRQAEAEEGADRARRSAEKNEARAAYERAQESVQDEEELAEATGEWARALDRINRAGHLAERSASEAQATLTEIEAALREAEREEQTLRIHAEQAEAGCLDARVRLAACEEGAAVPGASESITAAEAGAGAGGPAAALGESGMGGSPLVIESLVSGDRRALELAADCIAESTGLSPAEARLQLQELVDALVSAAAEDGYLVFDTRHPFWSHLTFEEARDVVAALARLGFLFEPAEGWHAGRAPMPSDLSMALAYAGLDTRSMRDLPDADELRLLPRSIGVDARAFLSIVAPDLTIDHLVRVLDRRAASLEPLWNEWGQVRPILLGDRHELGSLPG